MEELCGEDLFLNCDHFQKKKKIMKINELTKEERDY